MEIEKFDQSADRVIANMGSTELNWARFCIAPDKVEACKMPSMFPIPTHIVRRRLIKTVKSGAYDRLIWAPEYLHGQGVLMACAVGAPGNSVTSLCSPTEIWTGATVVQRQPGNWEAVLSQFFPAGVNTTAGDSTVVSRVVFDTTPALSRDVAEGGTRLLGACLKIQYMGKMDDIQGLIHVALNVNGVNQSYGTVPLSDMAFINQDALEQSPYYRAYRPSEGVRTIWFPIDQSRFEFAQPHYVMDRHLWKTYRNQLAGTSGVESTVETYVAATGSDILTTPGAGLHFTGTSNASYANGNGTHKLDNADHHNRSRIEWHIHFQGTGDQVFRVQIDQYYEVIPSETVQDDYNPQTAESGDSDNAVKVAYHMSKTHAVVSNSESDQPGFLRQAVAKIWDYGKSFVAPLAAAYAQSKGMGNLATGIMYGAGFGNSGSENDVKVVKTRAIQRY